MTGIGPHPCDDALRLAIALARKTTHALNLDPEPGDLVVELTVILIDPDAIGWLVGHGQAAYTQDGIYTGTTTREVWDIWPLSGRRAPNQFDRWENARFAALPDRIIETLHLHPPKGWASPVGYDRPPTTPRR